MADDSDTPPGKGKGARPRDTSDTGSRTARGFVRAGGLIEAPMRTAAARRGFAQAQLRALWPDIAGPEIAAVCAPVRLARARGPAGGLLTVAVSGVHAPQLQMLLPLLRERVNAALGLGTVGRIQLTQASHGFAEPPARFRRESPPPPAGLGRLGAPLSRIGDGELRHALETLARNVLSRSRHDDASDH
jgi:hypothetical protein